MRRLVEMPMTRLLLVPIALLCVVAGILPLVVACVAAAHGVQQALADPGVAPALQGAVLLAAAAAFPGAALGLLGAAALRHAPRFARGLLVAAAICLLVLPAPLLSILPRPDHPALRDMARLACGIARSAALMLLITAWPVAGIRPGLRRAALSAGATPFQAWRHTVLAPVWLPACVGVLAAYLVALAQTPAGAIVAPHMDLADAWIAPASLLLAACGAAALVTLLRRRDLGELQGQHRVE